MAARTAAPRRRRARVAITGPPALADKLRARLAARSHDGSEDFALVRRRRPAPPTSAPGASTPSSRSTARRRRRGAPAAARVLLRRDARALAHRARRGIEEALAAGAEPGCAPRYAVTVEGVAPRTAMGGYLLSKILPLIIVVMVMLGAFHPAIDITAGERERGTLETTLSAPIARAALMTGKVLAVATLAALTGRAQPRVDVAHRARGRAAGGGGRDASRCRGQRRRRRAAGGPARRLPVRVGHGRDRRARAQLQGGADAADAGLLPVHGAVADGGAGRLPADAARRRSFPGVGVTLLARDADAGPRARSARRWSCSPAASATARPRWRSPAGSTTPSACWAPTTPASACAPGSATSSRGRRARAAADADARRADAPPTAGHALALFGVACCCCSSFVPAAAVAARARAGCCSNGSACSA